MLSACDITFSLLVPLTAVAVRGPRRRTLTVASPTKFGGEGTKLIENDLRLTQKRDIFIIKIVQKVQMKSR